MLTAVSEAESRSDDTAPQKADEHLDELGEVYRPRFGPALLER